jgi:hypothetical protein
VREHVVETGPPARPPPAGGEAPPRSAIRRARPGADARRASCAAKVVPDRAQPTTKNGGRPLTRPTAGQPHTPAGP